MGNVKTEIKKASIKDERCIVIWNEELTEQNIDNEVTKKSGSIVHADLVEAFDKLKAHLVCICEQPEAAEIDEIGIYDFEASKLENYVITGYTLSGTDENRGVSIVGQKLLKTGQVLNISAPFTKFEDDDIYEHGGDLLSTIQGCNYEVHEYLFKDKWGIKQQEFDFDAETGADLKVVKEEAA